MEKEKKPKLRTEEEGEQKDTADGQALRAGPGRHSEAVRTRARTLAGTAREDSVNWQRGPALLSAGTSPAWAQACGTRYMTPAWRTQQLRREEQRGSGPHRSAGTSARRRYRCRA